MFKLCFGVHIFLLFIFKLSFDLFENVNSHINCMKVKRKHFLLRYRTYKHAGDFVCIFKLIMRKTFRQ